MTTNKKRVDLLEEKTGGKDKLPILVLEPVDYDKDHEYHVAGEPERRYTRDQFEELGERFTLIVVKWAKEWPPGRADGDPDHISLKWPEEL